MGKDYPRGYPYFRARLHKAFASQAHLQSHDDIQKAIDRAEYVKKEIEALYRLSKRRPMSDPAD